jgi:hypothetical protein
MIGRGRTITHAVNGLSYAKNKSGAQEVDRRYLQGNSPKEIASEFAIFGQMNTRCEKIFLPLSFLPPLRMEKSLAPSI